MANALIINEVVKEKNISLHQLEQLLGLANGTLRKAIAREGQLKNETILKIVETFPDINEEALRLGRASDLFSHNQLPDLSTAFKRLFEYLDYKNISEIRAASDLGMQLYGIANARMGDMELTDRILEKLPYTYPDLNLEWLLLGEGTMLTNPNTNLPALADTGEANYFGVVLRAAKYVSSRKPQSLNESVGDVKKMSPMFVNLIKHIVVGDRTIAQSYADAFLEQFPELNKNWLLFGRGSMTTNVREPRNSLRLADNPNTNVTKKNTEKTYLATAKDLNFVRNEDSTEFHTLGDDRYLIISPLITAMATHAYIENLETDGFIDELPRHAISLDSLNLGVYRSFTCTVDSPGFDSDEIIKEGWIVTGRRVVKASWKHGIGFRKFPLFVFVLKEGIVIRKIADYNVREGNITVDGPENVWFPDNTIKLSDVLEFFNVVSFTAQ